MGMISIWRIASDEQIAALLREPELIEDMLDAGGDTDEIDLDKAWHGIHYLLTGTAWGGSEPLNYIVTGGRTVGDIEIGYGPARVLSRDQVQAFQRALATVTHEQLRTAYHPKAMSKAEIYPDIWDRTDESPEEILDYLLSYFDELKAFVTKASDAGNGLISYIC